MSPGVTTRQRAAALPWLRALAFGGIAYFALSGLRFYPPAVTLLSTLAVGVLGFMLPGIGVLVLLIAVAIALMSGNLLVGALLVVVGFGSIQYLTQSDGRAFLFTGLALVATLVKAELGVAVIAGYLLGAGEGAVAAFVACLAIEGAGLLIGAPAMGTVATGGTQPIVDLVAIARIDSPLSFGWIVPALAKIDPTALLRAVTGARDPVLLALQPLTWAAAAALTGAATRRTTPPRPSVAVLLRVGAITVAASVIASLALLLLGGPVTVGTLILGGAVATCVSVMFAAVFEWVFPPLAARPSTAVTAAWRKADVDELLRTISSAEDELASQHTVHATVLISDMKSFSKLTERIGSAETAKLVQRHRDLLLPVIVRSCGRGMPTGGDGVLAAFDSPRQALDAAVGMQRVLHEYNARFPDREELAIRIGMASGEVLVDSGGRPFLGAGLNLAARVMDLADGGQIFAVREDGMAAEAAEVTTADHGLFSLKNISEPVPVTEVLWRQGQEPHPPSTGTSAN